MGIAELPGPGAGDRPLDLRRRTRLARRWRLVLLVFVIAYFFAPYEVHYWIPAWIPFLGAVYLELHFFLGGYFRSRRGVAYAPTDADRGPQARDLADFGGEDWREVMPIEIDGERHFVPIQGLSDEEVEERVVEYVHHPETRQAARQPFARPPLRAALLDRRYLLEALATLALVAGILWWASRPHGWDAVSDSNRARAEALFSREAAKIAGHRAVVRCDTKGEYVGFVKEADGLAYVGGSRAFLTPGICDTLYQLAFKNRTQSFPQTGRAIAVLAHEAWHLQGVSDEGLANCYGFQSGVQLGVDLGLSEGTARAMMRQQLATNALDSQTTPQYVVPSGCHNGGSEDLNPASSAFP